MRDTHHTWHPRPQLHLPDAAEALESIAAFAERHPSGAAPR
ncbi:MAG: hypothetical protein OEU32_19650 [Acidimicrobiia bacterium]|nr:hypothetical protein [Acidimicrobiia bacterium]